MFCAPGAFQMYYLPSSRTVTLLPARYIVLPGLGKACIGQPCIQVLCNLLLRQSTETIPCAGIYGVRDLFYSE